MPKIIIIGAEDRKYTKEDGSPGWICTIHAVNPSIVGDPKEGQTGCKPMQLNCKHKPELIKQITEYPALYEVEYDAMQMGRSSVAVLASLKLVAKIAYQGV